MKTLFHTAALSALALLMAGTAALAQSTLTGTTALNDRIDAIDTAVADDMARAEDASRFGNPEFKAGLSSSASLSYNGKTGNINSQDLAIGARLRFAQGKFVQTIGLALDYTEAAGVQTKKDVFGVYDANYYLGDSFYGFVLGRVKTDGLAATATDTDTDAFVGVGPGYRILNNPNTTWRVQAGVGLSYLKDGLGNTVNEIGYIASSRFFWKFSDNVFATNDTDFLTSSTARRVTNDFGVNFKLTEIMSTRVSYLTDYNSSNAVRTDNKVGVSLVFGF